MKKRPIAVSALTIAVFVLEPFGINNSFFGKQCIMFVQIVNYINNRTVSKDNADFEVLEAVQSI